MIYIHVNAIILGLTDYFNKFSQCFSFFSAGGDWINLEIRPTPSWDPLVGAGGGEQDDGQAVITAGAGVLQATISAPGHCFSDRLTHKCVMERYCRSKCVKERYCRSKCVKERYCSYILKCRIALQD